MEPLETSLKRQLDANKARNLLFEDVKQIMHIDPGFLAALEELLNSNASTLPGSIYAEIVTSTAKEVLKRLQSIHPYLILSSGQTEDLEEIYRQTWQMMIKTGNIKTTLKEFHYPALSKWLAALYPEKFRTVLKQSTTTQDNNSSREEQEQNANSWKMVLDGMKKLLES